MIKYCKAKHEKTIVNKAPTMTSTPLYTTMMSEVGRHDLAPNSSSSTPNPRTPPTPSVGPDGGVYARPHMHIAAIDNSLSFPHQHPRGWRSFTYGWLYLPVSLIGRHVILISNFNILFYFTDHFLNKHEDTSFLYFLQNLGGRKPHMNCRSCSRKILTFILKCSPVKWQSSRDKLGMYCNH